MYLLKSSARNNTVQNNKNNNLNDGCLRPIYSINTLY